MYSEYKFSNLLGTVYHKGDVLFSKDGNSIYVPVGNKITCYDLRNDKSYTLPVEVKGNFTSLALSPSGAVLLGATDAKSLHLINLVKKVMVYTKHYQRSVKCLAYSPDGKYIAVASGSAVSVYRCAGMEKVCFNPFTTETVCPAATSAVISLSWSYDSRLLAFGSTDMMTRVFPIKKMELGKQVAEMGSNSDAICGVHFVEGSYDLYSVCKSGKITLFECSLGPEDLQERIQDDTKYRRYLERVLKDRDSDSEDRKPDPSDSTWLNYRKKVSKMVSNLLHLSSGEGGVVSATPALDGITGVQTVDEPMYARVTTSCYHRASSVLVVALTTGDFALFDMRDDFNVLHSLNISEQMVDSVAINTTGDWVALGVSGIGQLLVWELRSETYVLKQQGHRSNMNIVAYSQNGECLASGGDDGKLKLWSTTSSFCYMTFSDHTAAITGLAFIQNGRGVLSSSLDGTVRAYDLGKYRCFKTLTSPRATQFTCLTVDSAGELVAAGGQDSHQIYLWSLKLGTLIEVLSGHTGPVSGLCFSPVAGSSMLVSTALDRTVKLWESINSTQARETVRLQSEGVCLSIRGDGEQVCVATMDGQLTLINTSTGAEEGCIEGRRDIGLTKADTDTITAEKSSMASFFQSVCYSSDGSLLLAGGKSKFVCAYSATCLLLVDKYTITRNSMLDGMNGVYNFRSIARNGIDRKLVERRPSRNSVAADRGIKLPGVKHGDKSLRAFKPEIRVTSLAFSATGRSFVVCCTEGLLVYSQDSDMLFDPVSLSVDISPTAVKRKLRKEEWSMALMMAIRLNITSVKHEALEAIPIDAMEVVISSLPLRYVGGLMQFLAEAQESTRHVGLYSHWTRLTLSLHGLSLKSHASSVISSFSALQRVSNLLHKSLNSLCESNKERLAYLLRLSDLNKRQQQREERKRKKEQVKGELEEDKMDTDSSEDDSNQSAVLDEDESDVDMTGLESHFEDSETDTEITELVK